MSSRKAIYYTDLIIDKEQNSRIKKEKYFYFAGERKYN